MTDLNPGGLDPRGRGDALLALSSALGRNAVLDDVVDETVRAYLAASLPPDGENPYTKPIYGVQVGHTRVASYRDIADPREEAWDAGFAAGRAAATPDPPKDAHRPWPIAPDTVMPPRRQPVRWGSRADDPPTEIHNDPQTTKAYLAGLAAGRTEAAASPDERLREAVAALPQYVITIQDREGYTDERGCEGQPMNYTGVMLTDVEALVGELKDRAPTARETKDKLKDSAVPEEPGQPPWATDEVYAAERAEKQETDTCRVCGGVGFQRFNDPETDT